jgi:activin receptor type-2B
MIDMCQSILEGLAFLHGELIDYGKKTYAIAHRDLKSKNILVKNDGRTCCIGDFGLALKLNNSNKLSSAEIRSKVGTRRYMSPELIEGAIAFTKETFLSTKFGYILF